jgi:two-component system NtrC family sensor kinase
VKQIVLVEDDEAFAYAASKALREAGFAVHAASGSIAAMDLVDAEKPDLLLIDVRLPHGQPHGLALGRIIRYRYPQMPVIYVTAYPDLVEEDGDAVGKVLQKPIDLDTLVSEVVAQIR